MSKDPLKDIDAAENLSGSRTSVRNRKSHALVRKVRKIINWRSLSAGDEAPLPSALPRVCQYSLLSDAVLLNLS